MTTPVKKTPKVRQDNKRKPTAQEMHQQHPTPAPEVNPTNSADAVDVNRQTMHHGTGYATPDSPSEGEASANVDSLSSAPIQNDGDKEIPQPESPQQTPVENNPKM